MKHNLEILRHLRKLRTLGYPVCIGTSHKSFIGKVLGSPDPCGRLAGTIATSVAAVMNGADIVRVHDVKEAVQAMRITDAVLKEN